MIVFKIERERPPLCVLENLVFYVKERQLRRLDLTTKYILKTNRKFTKTYLHVNFSKDVALAQVKANKLTQPFYSLHYNPAENCFLLVTRPHNVEASTYDFYKVSFFKFIILII